MRAFVQAPMSGVVDLVGARAQRCLAPPFPKAPGDGAREQGRCAMNQNQNQNRLLVARKSWHLLPVGDTLDSRKRWRVDLKRPPAAMNSRTAQAIWASATLLAWPEMRAFV